MGLLLPRPRKDGLSGHHPIVRRRVLSCARGVRVACVDVCGVCTFLRWVNVRRGWMCGVAWRGLCDACVFMWVYLLWCAYACPVVSARVCLLASLLVDTKQTAARRTPHRMSSPRRAGAGGSAEPADPQLPALQHARPSQQAHLQGQLPRGRVQQPVCAPSVLQGYGTASHYAL